MFAEVLHRNTETILFPDSVMLTAFEHQAELLHALRWQQTNKEQLIQLADGKISSWHFSGLSHINANILAGFH